MTTSDNASDERWYVQYDSREVKLMTLDELDAAFQQGLIHENTYLVKVGEDKWQTLADMLGSADDEEEPAADPEPVPPPAPAMPVQHASVAAIPGAARTAALPAVATPQRTAPMNSVWPPATSTAAGGGWPPVVSAPSGGYAPAPAQSHPSMAQGPRSTVPVVQDLSDLDLDAPFKRSRKGVFFFAAAAVAAAAGGVFALTRLDAPKLPTAAATPVAAAAAFTPYRSPTADAKPASAPTPAPAPAPEPKAEADTKTASAQDGRFSDDMKKALLAADQDRAVKKAAPRATSSRRVSAKATKSRAKSSSGFKGGGNTHDPLNPTL